MEKNKTDLMWETLISTLNNVIDNHSSNLEMILNMIRTDLTYDDPGLFPSQFLATDDERRHCRACNYWLINQLLRIASIDAFRSISTSYTELQKAIVSASFVKQTWLFYEIAGNFVRLLHSLNENGTTGDTDGGNPEVTVLTMFHETTGYDFSKLECGVSFATVEVSSKASVRALREHCLHIVSQMVSLVDEGMNEGFRMQCAREVLVTLNVGTLEEKTLALMFFAKYFRHLQRVSRETYQLAVDVISIAEASQQRTEKWLAGGLVQKKAIAQFHTVLMDFYAKLATYTWDADTLADDHRRKLIGSSVKLLCSLLQADCAPKETLADRIVTLLKQLTQCAIGTAELEEALDAILTVADQYPDVLTLLEYQLTLQLTTIAANDDDVHFQTVCCTWRTVLRKVQRTPGQIMIVRSVMNLAATAMHTFNRIRLQRRTEDPAKDSPHRQLLCFGSDLMSQVIEELYRQLPECESGTQFLATMECFAEMSVLHDFSLLPVELQFRVQRLLFAPFVKEFLPSLTLSENIRKLFLTPSDSEAEPLRYVQGRAIGLLSALGCAQLHSSVAGFVKETLWQLMASIISSTEISLKKCLLENYPNIVLSNKYPAAHLSKEVFTPLTAVPEVLEACVKSVAFMYCTRDRCNYRVMEATAATNGRRQQRKLLCLLCKGENGMDTENSSQQDRGQLMPTQQRDYVVCENGICNWDGDVAALNDRILALCSSNNKQTLLAIANLLPVILRHTETALREETVTTWSALLLSNAPEVCLTMAQNLGTIVTIVMKSPINDKLKESYIRMFLEKLLHATRECLKDANYSYQSAVLHLVVKFSAAGMEHQQGANNHDTLVHCVRLMLFFIMRKESEISREASLAVAEMCERWYVSPRNILSWYRHDIIKLMMGLAAINFYSHDIGLYKSITNISKTFEFSGPVEFVNKHYKMILAMMLPWCVKLEKCEGLLQELANIIRKDKVVILSVSFLTVYPYLFINESAEVTNKCIDYIMTHTGNTLVHLLHSDIKRTVSEILIFYHINADCVIHAFRSLLAKTDAAEITTAQMAEYIAGRFLGVLTFFEATLIHPENEKVLKTEALLSLGDIIRLLGGHYIGPFRFKIIALLKTTLAIGEPNLTQIAIKVWRIFICTVDVHQLGPLLSTIFVTLAPFAVAFSEDVNYIFRYLVLQNNSLLSEHLPDLFFLDDTVAVEEDVRVAVRTQMKADHRDGGQFIGQLRELVKHIDHENMSVRVFGLRHLKRLFARNRTKLNEAIVGQNTVDCKIEELLNTLVKSFGELDTNYRICAAECIGELGALAPSFLPPNYAPQKRFALSIHSDAFASMALGELCRAYQYQKDAKYVDSFSLAIQEILLERGVSPMKGTKVEVWEAIPERLRPIMEPLLTSCYTGLTRTATSDCHPIYGSARAHSCLEWSYLWASQMIENIENDETQNLLKSFKPSIRCDVNTMTLFIPYILLHSLQYSSVQNQKLIAEELQFVFNSVLEHNNSGTGSPEDQRDYIFALRTMNFSKVVEKWQKESNVASGVHTDMSAECAKLAFSLLDFLERWKRQWLKAYVLDDGNTDYHNVGRFLQQFDYDMLADINYKCHEYARALMYLEMAIEEDEQKLQSRLASLARIYSQLNDSDSVEGVMSLKRTEPTLAEQILLHNATGRLQESVACYERMLQVGELQITNLNNMIECYLRLDQPETALLLSESLLGKFYDSNACLALQKIKTEPLYRLGRFEELEELLEIPEVKESNSWGVICGSLMLSFRKNDPERFSKQIEQARLAVLRILHNSDLEIREYEKRYEQILKLHMITEFEKCGNILTGLKSPRGLQQEVKTLIENLNARLELLQPNAATLEPIISLRRILLNETKGFVSQLSVNTGSDVIDAINTTIDNHIGELWMKSTELASKANMHQQAQLYILHAESYRPRDLFVKKAKLLWEKRDTANALKVLERGVQEILDRGSTKDPKQLAKDERVVYAQGKLLIAIYNAEASNISPSMNHRCFKEALQADPESEKTMVHLAQYLDKLYSTYSPEEQNSTKGCDLLLEVMTYYGKSMLYGSKYIYQSMPRVLSIWLDFTARSEQQDAYRKTANHMNRLALKFKEQLSPYFFFTAFSQLVSRVAHPSSETYAVLKTIIVKLILNYPQQCLWMMLSVYKSSYTNRVKRCVEIFQDKKLAAPDVQKLIKDFNALAERLIELTNKNRTTPRNVTKLAVSSLVKALPKLLEDSNFSNILMPIQKCMELVLNKSSPTFATYPVNGIHIHGIDEEVVILQSLQKPRRITLIGSDGGRYTMMMKPKDDLRKDFRLMEFNAVVKQYLHQDPDAKHRRLNIRTYAVFPLNEECGIIEWVSNLTTFRSIVSNYYKRRGQGMLPKELLTYNFARNEPLAKKRDAFLQVLLPRHPSVFAEWFRDRFSNPHNWFQARSSYIRTTAVISMVGYILGLGDRHGENILFDSTSGDTMHVDFNCLFNKGETFDIPELVPFRLTHNMVKAMGPLGVEGLFRRCSEISLRVLQAQAPTLMSVLKPFVYDPLVSWSKVTAPDCSTERTDPQALDNVRHIEERLKGYVKIHGRTSHMPMSIEGQVNHLIVEATDIDNLAQMYIGWSGYM